MCVEQNKEHPTNYRHYEREKLKWRKKRTAPMENRDRIGTSQKNTTKHSWRKWKKKESGRRRIEIERDVELGQNYLFTCGRGDIL